MTEPKNDDPPRKKGFAAMDKDRLRQVAASGGAAVKSENRTFSKDRTLASNAGAKGGHAPRKDKPQP